ncbi:hypothetical protein JSO19_11065 [Leucobacter sp. UCMA 4100]|uniref:hypothetical protein n=1 Tax=Leucobacter sp. UCMA 4100 TaxID=2810534 RepID=UPI0022EB71C0|nr:hypothetical protein [Leucobacter sp. UCMA 4100]MDA3147916.1 hypothetical protein [Leucobacter sp. UCMA 4100]
MSDSMNPHTQPGQGPESEGPAAGNDPASQGVPPTDAEQPVAPKKKRASGLIFAIIVLALLGLIAAITNLGAKTAQAPEGDAQAPAESSETAQEDAPSTNEEPEAHAEQDTDGSGQHGQGDDTPGTTTDDSTVVATFTQETARNACVAEGDRLFPGLSPDWQSHKAVEKREGNAWFFKAPASSDAMGNGWFKCKVGGTPAAPEFYLTRLD